LSFQHLNDDTNSQETSLQASRKKAYRIKFLTEEIPTIEHMKKRRYDLYRDWNCPMCKNHKETFNHVFTCVNSKDKLSHIIVNSQKLLIKLLYDHAQIKRDRSWFNNMENIWKIHPSDAHLTFIDIVKGIVPLNLVEKINSWTKNKEMTGLIISIFMDYVYINVCKYIWFPRNEQQLLDETNAGIGKKEKKKVNSSNIRSSISSRYIVDTNSLESGKKGLVNSILRGGSWQDFTMFVNFFSFFNKEFQWLCLNTFSRLIF
jgi:hypothetical protein